MVSEATPKSAAIRGAVARVAAIVTAAPSATARRQPWTSTRPPSASSASRTGAANSMIPTTAAKLSCQPGSPVARGLIASVTAAASRAAYQRERGRPASAATTPAAPITPARRIDGEAPVTAT